MIEIFNLLKDLKAAMAEANRRGLNIDNRIELQSRVNTMMDVLENASFLNNLEHVWPNVDKFLAAAWPYNPWPFGYAVLAQSEAAADMGQTTQIYCEVVFFTPHLHVAEEYFNDRIGVDSDGCIARPKDAHGNRIRLSIWTRYLESNRFRAVKFEPAELEVTDKGVRYPIEVLLKSDLCLALRAANVVAGSRLLRNKAAGLAYTLEEEVRDSSQLLKSMNEAKEFLVRECGFRYYHVYDNKTKFKLEN